MKKITQIIVNNAKTIMVVALLDLLSNTISEIRRSQYSGKFDADFDDNKDVDTFNDKPYKPSDLVESIQSSSKLGKLFKL